MASLSLAMDLGIGQPMEWVISCCLLGVHFSELLGLSEHDRRLTYYLSLLRHIGCTSTATIEADVFGDELNLTAGLLADPKNPIESLNFLLRTPGKGQPLMARLHIIGKALAAGPSMKEEVDRIQCEVAIQFSRRLSFDFEIQSILAQVFERWDGRGVPNHVKGEDIVLPVRIVQLAQDMVIVQQMSGTQEAIQVAKKRAGYLYDPDLVQIFCEHADGLFEQLNMESAWDALLTVEPGTPILLSEEQFNDALLAMADFADLKSAYFSGHSRNVALLARLAALEYGLPESDAELLWRAGLVHDIGRVGVSAGIWNKPGPLSESEWERVRFHPYLTERILLHSETLAPLGALSALHHERLDGSGYYRGLPAEMQSIVTRILVAADTYQTKLEARPHRTALPPSAAAEELRTLARMGKIDAKATDCVLRVVGQAGYSNRSAAPAGLSQREIEVLRLMAKGFKKREIAERLVISIKTVDHHIQHIYNKIGLNTRAGAALFAMEHHLLNDIDVN